MAPDENIQLKNDVDLEIEEIGEKNEIIFDDGVACCCCCCCKTSTREA